MVPFLSIMRERACNVLWLRTDYMNSKEDYVPYLLPNLAILTNKWGEPNKHYGPIWIMIRLLYSGLCIGLP